MRVKATSETKQTMSVLLGTSASGVEECLRLIISRILQADYELTFSVLTQETELRDAGTTHEYGLVVLYLNTIFCEGGRASGLIGRWY